MKINEKDNVELTPEEFEKLFKFLKEHETCKSLSSWHLKDSMAQNKCMKCNQYHPVRMFCLHSLMWI